MTGLRLFMHMFVASLLSIWLWAHIQSFKVESPAGQDCWIELNHHTITGTEKVCRNL